MNTHWVIWAMVDEINFLLGRERDVEKPKLILCPIEFEKINDVLIWDDKKTAEDFLEYLNTSEVSFKLGKVISRARATFKLGRVDVVDENELN